MSNQKDDTIRIVKGSERFAGSPDTDLLIQVPIEQTEREYVEGDRTVIVSLEQQFDDERQLSDTFRISGKITNVFNNTIEGQSNYIPFRNSLYYTNEIEAITTPGSPWKGYPQFNEFSFFRTQSVQGHITFEPKSASTYNWMTYVSYPFENDTTRLITYTGPLTNTGNTFTVSDGVPYEIKNTNVNGKNLITFYCGTKHNLSVDQWVKLQFSVNNRDTFQVYSLGDESFGNEDKVFSIYNYGYNDSNFLDGSFGNFKKIIDINNSGETISRYYVRKHKILTDLPNAQVAKMGFENNPFPVKKKIEYSGLTPNNQERISVKDGNQTVSFTFDKDIRINPLTDNTGRPVTELFVTIVNRGYMGWFNNPMGSNSAIQVGWDFNLLPNKVDNWWSLNNVNNRDTIPFSSYTINSRTFFYNQTLKTGDELLGDMCEYNDYEQTETVLSKLHHKFSFNSSVFQTSTDIQLPGGYAYIPHHEIKIRQYSDYIELANSDETDSVPDYAYFSQFDGLWRWRDIYGYGYIDPDGNGVDYPFLNGAHYPFKQILFLQTPLITDYNLFNSIIFSPITDDCE
jgi:hypothetical protein